MPQLRKDPVTREWVIIAQERAQRPQDFEVIESTEVAGRPEWVETCPFCPGNEPLTPPEVLAYRSSGHRDGPNWWLRVVPNRYPALAIEGGLGKAGVGMYDTMNGVGAHEVVIEAPQHNLTLATLPDEKVQDVIWAYRDRYVDLRRDRRFRYLLIFRNQGRVAGASLEHAHSQLVATPIVPIEITQEMEGLERYLDYHDRCVYCDIVVEELSDGDRVVLENQHFVAFEPFASRYPFETWILPKDHQASFANMSREEVEQFASILKGALLRIRACLHAPPYNFTLHTAPYGIDGTDKFHWHLEIMPRLTIAAGFEMGTGISINVTAPEQAASYLREADPSWSPPIEVPAAKAGEPLSAVDLA